MIYLKDLVEVFSLDLKYLKVFFYLDSDDVLFI